MGTMESKGKYAISTSVSPDKTLKEIKDALKKYAATNFKYAESDELIAMTFVIGNRQVRFVMPLPDKKDAPTFDRILLPLQAAIAGRRLVIYNVAFDCPILENNLESIGIHNDALEVFRFSAIDCAMMMYAQYVGHWSSYHQSYRWQPLPGGEHTALGDCRATLKLIQAMAEDKES